jgi:hypothetical protein
MAAIKTNKNSNKGFNYQEQIKITRRTAIQSQINDGTISKDTLLAAPEVDMKDCDKPITVLQKIYSPISEVGIITVDLTAVQTVDVTTELGFEAFKKALVPTQKLNKQAKEKGQKVKHVKYETVWVKGYNYFDSFDFVNGFRYEYFVVTNEEFKMLYDALCKINLDELTVEEAQAIQNDLPPFIRAWQESSIDVSKDKDKVFDYSFKQFFSHITVMSHFIKTAAKKKMINFGWEQIKGEKHAGKTSVSKFQFNIPNIENVPMDLLGKANMTLVKVALDSLNGTFKEVYEESNNMLFEQFSKYAAENKEMAYVLKQMISIVYSSFTSNEDDKIEQDKLNAIRNAAYSIAHNYGIEPEDVIKIAISTTMSSVYLKDRAVVVNNTNVNKVNLSAIERIFPNELIEVLAGRKQTVKLALEYSDREITDGERIVFCNGASLEINDETGEAMIELKDDFTGEAYECEGKLVYDIDAYSYEFVNAFVMNETFKPEVTTEDIKAKIAIDENNEFRSSMLDLIASGKGADTVRVTGKAGNVVKVNDQYVGYIFGNTDLKKTCHVVDIVRFPASEQRYDNALVILA